MERALEVLLDGQRTVGVLHENGGVWRFDYDPAWAQAPDGFDLAPGLPRSTLNHLDGGTQRPVQWYFDNLLPEEGARLLVSREAGVDQADAFALLEYLGAESAGSLVLLQDGQLFEPVGGQASTHILKPDNRQAEYPATSVNEYLMMCLAGRIGLDVPRVHLRYTPEPVYIIERFDRRAENNGKIQRLHAIDACQLLSRARAFKYHEATLENLSALADRCRNRAATRLSLYRWLVFNVLIGNGDNHLKNLSFLVSAAGIELAPAYDLLCTGVYEARAIADDGGHWPAVGMPIQLPGARTFGEVNRQVLLDAGEVMGVPSAIGRRELDRLLRAVPVELTSLVQAFERVADDLVQGPALPFLGGQRRVVNVIRHVVVADMIRRM